VIGYALIDRLAGAADIDDGLALPVLSVPLLKLGRLLPHSIL